MQFKYPELLWALFFLLIPILIHLFQLRRFKKTPFTNVSHLKKVVAKSRRSNTLKKWLLLFTRLILIAALVLAFAQPFLATKQALQQKETVIYLDDSFSMQLKKEGATLLENAVQQLVQSIPKEQRFSLFTNQKTFKDVLMTDVQNELLSLSHTSKQLRLNAIGLKARSLFSTQENSAKNLIIVSDFQQTLADSSETPSREFNRHLVQMAPEENSNVAIDSAFFDSENTQANNMTVMLSSNSAIENTPVSLYNGNILTAKTSASFNEEKKGKVNFTLPSNEIFKGKIEISDPGLTYDNQLYFNLDKKEKIKVMAIGPADPTFLKRIFSEDEFIFTSTTLKNLNYGILESQNLLILNGLPIIPTSLVTGINNFMDKGGHFVILPSDNIDIDSYSQLTVNYFSTSLYKKMKAERDITQISFSHPLFRNVFEKNVSNFQYPKVSNYYQIKTTAPSALTFQNGEPFLVGAESFFLFTAPLSSENSNFRNSPLIVPTFYNMGINSLNQPMPYHTLGDVFSLDVPIILAKDRILKVISGNNEHIPQQRSLANKVSLVIDASFEEAGIHSIKEDDKAVATISLNHDRKESELMYLDIEELPSASVNTSINALFQKIEKDNSLTELWKWFVILALLFLLLEILIQKYLK